MPLILDLDDVVLAGSAMTGSFLRTGLPQLLNRYALLPDGIETGWDKLRHALRRGRPQQIPGRLAMALGYRRLLRQGPIVTRQAAEDGGWLMRAPAGTSLRAWTAHGRDLDAPARDNPARIAQRVLLASRERAGLLANDDTLRLLLSDAARADSSLSVPLDLWRDSPAPPDSFRLLLGLVGAQALPHLPQVLEAARLHQARVTTELRRQAQEAISGFINAMPTRAGLDAQALWRESLVLVYRLLFILKLESPTEPGGGFSFASARLWRSALSPNQALGPLARRVLDRGADTGRMLEDGLRLLFGLFRDGLSCSELQIAPLGGALFGLDTTPLLDRLNWGERAVAILLDRLLWIPAPDGERIRVHYGNLDVEDLGSVYEGLLEQEPGIADEPMLRLRRGKQDFVVPANAAPADILTGAFFLRAGTGRKSSGSFYTPHEFVRFLVRETLAPWVAAVSPPDDPNPAALLRLKVVDPAAGSGHFLVEACRYLGEALLTACLLCDERGLHERIAALPDPDNTIAPYLPNRGYAEARARAICRRLVAVHCLYGCDRNGLAVELAKLSLWLESFAEGLPLTFLDHRLVQGDALTGPLFDALGTLPVTGGALDPLLAQGVAQRLEATLALARRLVTALDASIGRTIADVAGKQAAKARLDALLDPLRRLAKAWSGAAMLRGRDSDDLWLGLARHVADTGAWPDALLPGQRDLLDAGMESVAWDLVFPEIFPAGFAAVLGNPPWDVVLPNAKDFLSAYDPAVLDGPTRDARMAIERRLLARPDIAGAFEAYRSGFDRTKRIARRLYRHQRISLDGGSTAGSLDLFRLFAERVMRLAAADASIGLLLPSAFHANEGSTGIRRLFLEQSDVIWCLSFENRRRVFDIDSRFKFDVVVARRPGPTAALRCGFYLDRIEDVQDSARILTYSRTFLEAAGGPHLTPLELRGAADVGIAERMFAQRERLGGWCERYRIRLGNDLHMTGDAGCFRPLGGGDLIVHEGKTFHQYTDAWDSKPRYSVASDAVRPVVTEAARYARLVFRDIARSNDERTMIACIAPPGVVFGHTATAEKTPWARATADALVLCALFNSFCFDWLIRQKAATHLSLYLLEALPVPALDDAERRFLAHAALRLSCNHPGFDALWREQVGAAPSMPVAERPVEHWATRAAIDAVVANAYRLDRGKYAHVLSSFSHRSHPDAATLCLAAFGALQSAGLEAFCRLHDPHWGIPLCAAPAGPRSVSHVLTPAA